MDSDNESINYVEAYVIGMHVKFQLHPSMVSDIQKLSTFEKLCDFIVHKYIH